MAYMNQEKKAKIAALMKPIMKKYGVKGSLSVHNHSSVTLTLKSGSIDFVENFNRVCGNDFYQTSRGWRKVEEQYLDVNPYWYHEHFDGKAKEFLGEAIKALKSADWYDRSDAQTDYFDTAYYYHIKVGKWDKPYEVIS